MCSSFTVISCSPPWRKSFDMAIFRQNALRNRKLRIPVEHAETCVNTLNQARVVIAAKYNFSEEELNDHDRSPIGSRRDLGLFQVNFYGFLQEFILRELGGQVGSAPD